MSSQSLVQSCPPPNEDCKEDCLRWVATPVEDHNTFSTRQQHNTHKMSIQLHERQIQTGKRKFRSCRPEALNMGLVFDSSSSESTTPLPPMAPRAISVSTTSNTFSPSPRSVVDQGELNSLKSYFF
jgi:hypothetical protein